MANSVDLKEFYERHIYDRHNGTPDTNALDILIGTGTQFSVDITGTPTGGTFKLTWGGEETGAIAYDADATAVDTAITALSGVGASEVAVTGTNPNFTAVFTGANRFTRNELTLSDNSLTGGTSPSVTIAQEAAGNDTMLALFETCLASMTTEFSDDTEEDRVMGEVMSHLGDAAATILANVK